MYTLTRNEVAKRVAKDIPNGSYVNLGIGFPTLVANYIPNDSQVTFHSENGMLGMGPEPTPENIQPNLIHAGNKPSSILPGGSFFHHADSFAMIRGGHIDITVLGAFQVSERGDLANWRTREQDAIPAVGGAMDLVVGAKQVFIIMTHLTKEGESKIVSTCDYPLTGVKCVDRIYTDLAVIDVTDKGLKVIEIVDGLSFSELSRLTQAKLYRD